MTVLQRKQTSGAQLGQLGRILGSMLAIGVIVAGAFFVSSQGDSSPSVSAYEHAMQARGQAADAYYEAQRLEQANELNKADIGVSSSNATPVPTHVPGAPWGLDAPESSGSTPAPVDLGSRIDGFPASTTDEASDNGATTRGFGEHEAR